MFLYDVINVSDFDMTKTDHKLHLKLHGNARGLKWIKIEICVQYFLAKKKCSW